ncbi:MFS transporter [Kitasatospora sp. GP82]|uniref:MFS transporter n=1 Tax=Kitasatospora sp. GP82 TaxID=3035089 RepID=UPI002475F1CB|nr:MFS transporter [Kitasatospora sp. GP82]MDH6124065.1 putative MFS family arabinose efflux permease [Kitasatospora sp. GP82]
MTAQVPTPAGALRSRHVTLMALASGVSVANIYYLQPLLRPLAKSFGVDVGTAGLLPMATMIGYALGLLLLVPLADRLGVRRLSLWLNTARTVALLVAAAAPGYALFAVAAVALGLSSVLAQVLTPVAVSLAAPDQVGRITARITAGLFGGIVGARVLAGTVADAVGWRWVYVISAILTVALAVALRSLPEPPPRTSLPYPKLLASLVPLLRQERNVRRAIVVAASGFASFNLLWTSITLYVTGAPHHWSTADAGLLGLVGIAGTVTVMVVGRFLERNWFRLLTVTAAAAMTVSLLAAGVAGAVTPVLVAACLVLDSGARVNNVANQTHALRQRPDARARVNTLYMTGYFAAGSLGSAAGTLLFTHAGWLVTCAVSAALSAFSGIWAFRAHGRGAAEDRTVATASDTPLQAAVGGAPAIKE